MASGNVSFKKYDITDYLEDLVRPDKSGRSKTFKLSMNSMVSPGDVVVSSKNSGDNKLDIKAHLYAVNHTPTGYSTLDYNFTAFIETPNISDDFDKLVASSGGDVGEAQYKLISSFQYPRVNKKGEFESRVIHLVMEIPTLMVVI